MVQELTPEELRIYSLNKFWTEIPNDYAVNKAKALRILLLFPTSYLCETDFSALAALKFKFKILSSLNKISIKTFLTLSIAFYPP